MIGDVATTHHRVESIEALHTSVSVDSEALVEARAEALEEAPAQRRSTDIAIVGIATLLPEAQDPQHFWANLLAKKVAVKEVPESRWDWRLYYDPDTKAPDKSHSRWGGFFDDVVFDPVKFGIPPNSMRSIGPGQLLSLEMVRRALADADYADRPFDRENTAVIMANGDLGGLLGNLYVTRTMLPLIMGEAPKDVTDRLPEWTEEAFTGSLTNIAAGRVANRFDFGGANYTVDAACASSLTAVDLAAKELETHRCNVAIVGGVDVGQTPYGFVAFSKTQALSPSGATRTFDKDADGIVISEGLVFVVLKRLEDAERDGDKVYAVIKSVGTSSDGKALGMTAPRPLGQMRAVHRAYERAGFPLRSIGFYEAHGTGTPVGDRAELETIDTSLRTDGAEPHTVALGSVKTLIGHTKTAAGLVGLVKGALALRHQVLPAHAGVENPLQPLLEPECPLYLLDQAKPWFSSGQDPRRVGVSAFGFGGTNTHVVLEEYDGQRRAQATGAADWPCELIWLRGETSSALRAAADALLQSLTAGAEPRLADLGYACARNAKSGAHSAAIVAESVEHLRTSLATLLEYLDGGSTGRLPAHIQVGSDTTRVAGQVAFLFPGQGSQYVNMAREAALYCDEFRDGVEHSEAVLAGRHGRPLSDYVYPPAAFTDEERARQEEALKDTHVAQPAIGAVSCSYLALARRLGLRPDMVAGHSYGEFTALYAAGSLSYDDLLALSEARGRAIAQYNGEPGGMGAIQAPRADVEKRLRDLRVKDVVIANHNAPRQTIVSGAKDSVARVLEAFEADGTMAVALPVSAAFHSPLMAPARAALAEAIAAATLRAPSFPVYSNVTAAPYDGDIARMRRQLEDHLTRPVEFLSEIERMYADGARVFVEMGPNSVLRDLSDRILGDREHLSVSMDPKNTGLRGLLHALGRLLVSGVALDLPALFAGRAERSLDLNRLVEQTGKPPIPPTAWIVTGTNIRPVSQETSFPGKAEYFTSETAPTWRPTTTPGGLTTTPGNGGLTTTPGNGGLTTTPGNGGLTTSAEAYADHAPTTAEVVTTPQQTPPHQTLEEAPMNTDPLVAAYESYQETMRVFLRTQEEVMRSFLAATEGVPVAARPAAELPRPSLPAPTPPPPAPAPKPVPVSVHTNGKPAAPVAVPEPAPKPAPDATPALTHDTILSRLVTLLSEKTGYPAEFLGVDLDLEAELGIDSIKR
ncbi:MAG: acyltransferase domain-containing protein, partial [Armatimonadetes bacterium]|nr:acyltransferase domain-containing protein [Armatimonadota bacterium]